MSARVPPRLYCIPATHAPVVAVFRRGPSNWSQVGRWDLASGCYEPGAWLGGRIFPRRSDLSPDGRYLCYFAHKPSARWEYGEAYVAISKLPWLTMLHAFETCGTWTRGFHFTETPGGAIAGEPCLPIPFGLRSIPVVQFANERRRGWEETPDSPARDPGDAWDEQRNACIRKRQPGGETWLYQQRRGRATGGNDTGQAIDGMRAEYWLEAGGDLRPLRDLQWADWDAEGRLLAATRSGRLQIREGSGDAVRVLCEEDLAPLAPDPRPAPEWARRW